MVKSKSEVWHASTKVPTQKLRKLGVLQRKGVETVAMDYDKHCRTKPKHQQPRELKENCFAHSCHFDLASASKVTLILDKTSLSERHLKLSPFLERGSSIL